MAESHREEIAKLEALYAGNPGGRVFVHLAEAYRKAGEHERARRILEDGLARHPESASGYVVLGRVLADMQITAEAESAFQRVLELDGGNLVALRWLGDLARQSGRNAEAAMHYRELLVRNPSNEEVRELVEIVEREGESSTAAGVGGDDEARSQPLSDWSMPEEAGAAEHAVAEPLSEAEEPAVTAPALPPDAAAPDTTPWSAAPGQTLDAEEPPVEYGLVELVTAAADDAPAEPAPPEPAASEGSPELAFEDSAPADVAAEHAAPPVEHPPHEAVFEPAGTAEDSDIVASLDAESDLLELEELRRDDEAEPVEIHMLDPSFEGFAAGEPGEEDDFLGELDLSEMGTATSYDDDDDYADDSFVADLSAAGQEEPEPDELAVPNVLEAGAALTLLPEDSDAGPAPQAAPFDAAAEAALLDAAAEAPFDAADVAALLDAAAEAPFDAVDEAALLDAAAEAASFDAAAEAASFVTADEAATLGAAGQPAGVVEDLSEAGRAELTGAPAPASEADAAEPARADESAARADVRHDADATLVTETMAVLYRSQGHHEMAADVYRSLLRTRPGDERLAAKLREADEAARTAGRSGEAAPDAADDEAGEVWLRGVGTAWTGSTVADTADASPYVWTTDTEDTEAGEPIGSYLRELVAWKAGSGRWMPQQAEAHEPDTPAGGDFTDVPDWMNGPGVSQPEWTPASEPPAYGALPATEAGWSPAEPAAGSDPWSVPSDAGESAGAAAPEPEPASPFEPWQAPADALPEPGSGTPADASADPGLAHDSGTGWTPLQIEDDGAPAAPTADAAAAPHAQAGPQEEADSAEDEDLEMFRSWLQSLKK